MDDLIRRQNVIDALELCLENDYIDATELLGYVKSLPSAEPEQKTGKWIPFTKRELTEEEREEHPEWTYILNCKLPADGETVLLTNGKYVWEDMFNNDDCCYFDRADDIEDFDGYAWMPMPEPYKG